MLESTSNTWPALSGLPFSSCFSPSCSTSLIHSIPPQCCLISHFTPLGKTTHSSMAHNKLTPPHSPFFGGRVPLHLTAVLDRTHPLCRPGQPELRHAPAWGLGLQTSDIKPRPKTDLSHLLSHNSFLKAIFWLLAPYTFKGGQVFSMHSHPNPQLFWVLITQPDLKITLSYHKINKSIRATDSSRGQVAIA